MQEVSEADVDSLIRGGPDELELAAHRMSTDLFGLSAIPQVTTEFTVALCSVLLNQGSSDPSGLSSAWGMAPAAMHGCAQLITVHSLMNALTLQGGPDLCAPLASPYNQELLQASQESPAGSGRAGICQQDLMQAALRSAQSGGYPGSRGTLLGPDTGLSCPEAFLGRHGVALERPWPAQYEPGRHPHLSAFELLRGAVCKVEQTSSEADGQAAQATQAQHYLELAQDCHEAFRLPNRQQQPGVEPCGSLKAPQAIQRPDNLQTAHAEDRHAAELRSPSKPPSAKVSDF